mmetsp:Transcript_26775/g.58217  ORF Transcript_26775/g.58217 Transcript_26775/m.58217 type:complete len:203 (-) Transcript_26775:175-783(-)
MVVGSSMQPLLGFLNGTLALKSLCFADDGGHSFDHGDHDIAHHDHDHDHGAHEEHEDYDHGEHEEAHEHDEQEHEEPHEAEEGDAAELEEVVEEVEMAHGLSAMEKRWRVNQRLGAAAAKAPADGDRAQPWVMKDVLAMAAGASATAASVSKLVEEDVSMVGRHPWLATEGLLALGAVDVCARTMSCASPWPKRRSRYRDAL